MYKRVNELLGTEYKCDSEIDWVNLSINYKLSEDFIREFKDKINWNQVSIHQELSEDFIREFKNRVDWIYISHCQVLSWNFILEFKDKVNWNNISLYQPFINPNYEKINKKTIKQNKFYQLYQQTKDRGWFLGYVYTINSKIIISLYLVKDISPFLCTKSKVYWKDLKKDYFKSIRQVKYV